MTTSVTPALIDALVSQCAAALPEAEVVDGWAVTDSPAPLLLSIGLSDRDPDQTAPVSASSQSMATAGTPRSRDQSGSITCLALAWGGDADLKTVRDAVYGLQSAVEDILRADPTLGVGQPGRITCQLGEESLSQRQYGGGADALLIFTVTFTARI